jgi:hypothetical protein
MELLARALRVGTDAILWPLDGLAPLWSLTIVSVVTAVAILVVVRYTTPARWIERARSQIAACIYEVRLFLDSPRQVIRTQGRMLMWTGVYIGALLPALIVMSLPMGLLYLQLEIRHDQAALPTGEPVVVRVALAGDGAHEVTAKTGEWGAITAPPVIDRDGGAVYFRLRVDSPGTWPLEIQRAGKEPVIKRIDADPGSAARSPARVTGLATWWASTDEPPIPEAAGLAEISVPHPALDVEVAWMPWWLFWLLFSTILALALRRPFGVTL